MTHETARRHLEKRANELFPPDTEPTVAESPAIAAIWNRLPDDQMQVELIYKEAIQKGQTLVCKAIESLPCFFSGALDGEKLAELRNERLGHDIAPHTRAAFERQRQAVKDTESAFAILEERLDQLTDPPSREEQAEQLAQESAEATAT